MVCATSKASDQSAHTRSLIRAFASRLNILISMSVELLNEHHLEYLSLKGASQAHLSLHLLKCHIIGNHMSRLIITFYENIGEKVLVKLVNLFLVT